MSNCETVAVTFDVEDIAVEVVCVEPQIEVRVTMSPTWADVADKPAAFPPSAHAANHAAGGSDAVTLTVGQVTGLQAALDSKATPADVTAAVSGLVNSAPAALDTLNELASARGNDANFASTVTTALAAKAPLASPTFIGTVSGVTKGMVGLGNVDNTADASKPVSTAQAAADAAVASAAAADATSKANAAQAAAVQRANHTGTQAINTVSGLQAALDGRVATTDSRLSDAREWSAATIDQAEAEAGTGTTRRAFTAQRVFQAVAAWWAGSAAATKLAGIATGATANATDAQLRDRSTHTGTQAADTINGLAPIATSGSATDLSGTVPIARIPTGSSASTVCIGNDARLSDSRTPTAGSVTDASIVSTGLSTSSLNWAAIQPWAANTAYAKGDLVSFLGIAYRRAVAGTSGATFMSANWQQITPTDFVASQIASGTIATARLGSGTASATNYLRGDQAWGEVAAAPAVYEFTTTSAPSGATGSAGAYTWTIPAGVKALQIFMIGGGGGGGSGRVDAAGTARSGGGGGGGASCTIVNLLASGFSALDITVGAGGAGGAAATSATSTNGNSGSAGGTTTVRVSGQSSRGLLAFGGGAGGGGASASGSAGGGQTTVSTIAAVSGGSGRATSAGDPASGSNPGCGGGGGGGGVDSANTASAGGAGSPIARLYGWDNGNAAGGNNTGGNGAAAVTLSNIPHQGFGSGGGGGGGRASGGNGGSGGNGYFGGGGGGGGAASSGNSSGAGGNGGDGLVRIIAW